MNEVNEALHECTWATFQLSLNLGLIASVIDQYPEHVQTGFVERLLLVRDWANQQTEEAQSFGEAYDDDTEADTDEGAGE